FAGMATDDLLKALASPDFTDRLKAQQQLAKKGGPVRNELLDLAVDSKATAKARIAAVGALGSLWNDEVKDEFLGLLYAGDPDLRRLAADALALNSPARDATVDMALLQVLGDQDLAARRAIT